MKQRIEFQEIEDGKAELTVMACGVSAEVLVCPGCSSKNIVRAGHPIRKGGPVQGYVCKDCGHRFIEAQK